MVGWIQDGHGGVWRCLYICEWAGSYGLWQWSLSFPKTSFMVPIYLIPTALPQVLHHCLPPFSSSLCISRATRCSRAGSSALPSPLSLLPCVFLAVRSQPEAKHMNLSCLLEGGLHTIFHIGVSCWLGDKNGQCYSLRCLQISLCSFEYWACFWSFFGIGL